MPKLAAVVESLESVPQAYRELYTPSDGGKFVLDADVTDHPATLGLRSKNQELIRGQNDLKTKFKAFEGLDPEDVQAALKARADAEEARKRQEGDFTSLKQQLMDQHAKEKKAWEDQLAELTGTIEQVIGTDAARAAIVAEEGEAELLLPHVRAQVKVVKDGKSWKRVVIDGQGQTRYNAKGEEMSVRELVAEMKGKDTYKPAFKAPDTTGSGARPNTGFTGSAIRLTKEQAKDPQTYRRAKEEAEKRGVPLQFSDT